MLTVEDMYKSGLLSTPDGNKYFRSDNDFADYIEEKCGSEVAAYIREVFSCVISGEVFTPKKIAKMQSELSEFLWFFEDHEELILRLKRVKGILPVLNDLSNLLEEIV